MKQLNVNQLDKEKQRNNKKRETSTERQKKETKQKPKQINKKNSSHISCWREVHLSTSVFLVLVVLGAAMKGRVAPLAQDVSGVSETRKLILSRPIFFLVFFFV
jgi:hypothetical protein